MPCQRKVVDWVPISGGGDPSSVPTAMKAPAHEAPASRAAPQAATRARQTKPDNEESARRGGRVAKAGGLRRRVQHLGITPVLPDGGYPPLADCTRIDV